MSPLDDELRTALQHRAAVLPPSPDPLAGIEQRARRMHRNRAASAVAASALAVAAIALAVPALTPSSSPSPVGPATSAPPSAPPSAVPSAVPSQVPPTPGPETLAPAPTAPVFRFEAPWAYRGDRGVLGDGFQATATREWAATKGVAEDRVELVPLYGEVFEPSGQPRLVYAARVLGSVDAEYGAVTTGEAGPELVSRTPLDRSVTVLLVPVPGDEIPGLYAVAAPDTARLEYAADGTSYRDMADKAPGVGLVGLEGDTSADQVRLTDADGSTASVPAPELEGSSEPASDGLPENLLEWGFRGVPEASLVERAVRGYAAAQGVARDDVEYQVLFNGSNDPGQRYTVLQAWVSGELAQVVAWVETPGRDPELQLRPLTDPGAPVVAVLLTGTPGRTTDELVVIPQPRTGQVLYGPTGTGEPRPVEPTPGLDGVVLIDRALGADADRLVILDGDGDLDAPTFDGRVVDLLCGERGCG